MAVDREWPLAIPVQAAKDKSNVEGLGLKVVTLQAAAVFHHHALAHSITSLSTGITLGDESLFEMVANGKNTSKMLP